MIDPTAQAGNFRLPLNHHDEVVTTHDYTLFPREKGAAELQGFNNEDVMYLITPDRFANGDSTNDNITGMREKVDPIE